MRLDKIKSSVSERALRHLQRFGPVSTVGLAEATRSHAVTIHRAMAELCKQGKVRRKTVGREAVYEAVETPDN